MRKLIFLSGGAAVVAGAVLGWQTGDPYFACFIALCLWPAFAVALTLTRPR
jgi:divalent metal cation (Fe/Co/Zn/Cd) transporter